METHSVNPFSSYSNQHRIQILQIIAILHMISLEPFAISAYCTHWWEPKSSSSHCRFMLTKMGRSQLAEMLTDFIGRYIHLQIILILFYGICGWDIIWHRIPLMLTGEWSSIQEIRKENNCQEASCQEGKLNIWCNILFPARSNIKLLFDRNL